MAGFCLSAFRKQLRLQWSICKAEDGDKSLISGLLNQWAEGKELLKHSEPLKQTWMLSDFFLVVLYILMLKGNIRKVNRQHVGLLQ